jgi:nucleotide-binding universal stress UspA family protein
VRDAYVERPCVVPASTPVAKVVRVMAQNRIGSAIVTKLPTDGSQLSEAAIQAGVRFAKSINAKVTGFYAMPKFHMLTYQTEMLTDTKPEFAKDCKAHADRLLAVVVQAAKAADVPCETVLQTSDHPYEAIIATAKEKGCDLIMMASHGRSGVQAFLLGSETQKVLTHSAIPVLVFR